MTPMSHDRDVDDSIAVVIPTHNRPDALVGAVGSVVAQTSAADEVVVVDDGSQPPVHVPVLRAMLPNISVLRNDSAGGGNAARNRGWRSSTSEWVAFLDDDDRFAAGKLAALREAMRTDPGADVLYHTAWIRMVNEGVGYQTAPKDLRTSDDPYTDLLVGNYVGGTSMVAVRRSALQEVGGFDGALPSMQDYDLWLRLAEHGFRFHLVEGVLTDYAYVTGGSQISTDVDRHFRAAEAIEAKHASGYARLTPSQQRAHRVFVLNVATHRALLAGDAALARKLQREVLRTTRSPSSVAAAAVTMLGPNAAFRLRSMMSRGPTAARPRRTRA
jgi:GT2 family glycosyltransferase